MNKLYSVITLAALMGTLVGCGADGQDSRINRYQGYQGYQMNTNATNQGTLVNKNTTNVTENNDVTGNGVTGNDATGNQNNDVKDDVTNDLNNDTAKDENAKKFKGYFKDVPSGQWFTENIEWAKDAGILSGYPGGNFQPNKPVTRAEIATIIHNMVEKGYISIPDETDQTPVSPVTPNPVTDTDNTTPDTNNTVPETTPGT